MMKRGCRIVFIHFHGHPFVSRASADKAEELARHLTRHQYYSARYLLPSGISSVKWFYQRRRLYGSSCTDG